MENEIKVNEYIRTKRGIIDKAVKILDDYIFLESKFFITEYGESSTFIKKTDVVKHSSNIIDLIEVGDILKLKNGEKWEVQEHQGNGNWLQLEWENIDDNEDFFKKVDSIITKEQFESISYKVTKM